MISSQKIHIYSIDCVSSRKGITVRKGINVMNQEYEYYNPGPEPSGNGSFSNENPKRPKKKVNKAVVGKVAGLAVLFGVVGGLTFRV